MMWLITAQSILVGRRVAPRPRACAIVYCKQQCDIYQSYEDLGGWVCDQSRALLAESDDDVTRSCAHLTTACVTYITKSHGMPPLQYHESRYQSTSLETTQARDKHSGVSRANGASKHARISNAPSTSRLKHITHFLLEYRWHCSVPNKDNHGILHSQIENGTQGRCKERPTSSLPKRFPAQTPMAVHPLPPRSQDSPHRRKNPRRSQKSSKITPTRGRRNSP